MNKFNNLNSKIPRFEDGVNPPALIINPDYKQQPSNPRRCVQCGKLHDTIVENMKTGERLEEIDKCKDCLFFGTVIKLDMGVAELG